MEERKLIRRRAMKQKSGVFYRKSAATTAALVSTVNILPVSVLADTLESTEAQNGVRVVETADSSQDHSTQDTSTQDSVIVVEDNATNDESGTQDNSDSSNVDVVGVPESEDIPERVPADDTASEQEETEIGSDIPVLSEEERIAIETKVMPNYNNPMARSTNQQAFIQQVGPMAQEVAGANDLYASVMIAQAILESGWGQSTLTTLANNMFGIKGSYNGQFVEMQTMEDDGNGNLYPIIAKFRKYPSLKESFQDNAHVLKTTSFSPGVFFYHGAWKSNTSSYRDATQWLQGRYATDTSYASKLNNLIETYNLTQYDTSSGGGSNNNNNNNNSEQAINKQFRTNAALNIRSDASTSASIVGSLAANATFQAVAQKSGTSVNGNTTWYRIQGRGWVSAAHVTEISSNTGGNGNNNNGNNNNTEQSINKEFRTTAALNIRSDASTSASVVGSLANNTTFRAVAQKTGTSVNGNNVWYRIQGRGWVSAAYVSEVSSGSNNTEQSINKEFRTTATLNIRSDASTSANIVGSLSSNASFRAVAQKTGTSVNGNNIWYRIEGRGWVSAAYVRENSTSSSSTTHTVRSGDTLWGISQRYGVTVNQLMQWNNLSGSLIVVGQRLVVSR